MDFSGFGNYLKGLVGQFLPQQQTPPSNVHGDPNSMKLTVGYKPAQAMAAESTPPAVQQQVPQFGDTLKTQIPQNIQQMAAPIFQQYQIPPQVGFGQLAIEGHGTHKYSQAPFNNPYDIGAYDSNPDSAVRYPDLQKGIEAYAKLMSGKYELDHIGSGKFDTRYANAYQLRNNPQAMLQEIAKVGYASNPNYAQGVMNTPEWQYYNQKK
jgi:flagellum-specific peptidoglycan hydrolase FlgJ